MRILSFLAFCVVLPAQTPTGGVVKSGNQPVSGATVTAVEGGAKLVTVTDAGGYYSFPALGPGVWTIEVQMFGFEPMKKEAGSPAAAKGLDFNLKLLESPLARRIAAFSRTGGNQNANQLESQIQNELKSEQPQQAGAASANGNEAFLISGSLSQGLSANAPPDFAGNPPPGGGRGEFPGGDLSAQSSSPPGFGNPGGGFGGGGGGQRGFGGGFGGPGGGPGGRRGPGNGPRNGGRFGNRRQPAAIHGMLFWTLNNSALNAKPFSITGQNISQPAYASSRFGFVLGGPLVVPKIVKDTSTFFFLSYFATRAKNAYTAVETVPTALEREGDFSQSAQSGGAVQIYDPTTHQPFPANTIPANLVNPIAKSLLNYFPLPNQPGVVNNYDFQASVPSNTNNFNGRVQRNVSSKDRLAFHIGYQGRNGDNAQPFGFLDTTSGMGLTTDLSWTRNVKSTVISTARVNFNRNRNENDPFFAFGSDVAAELGIAGTSSDPRNYGPPSLNFTNFGPLSDATPVLTRNQSQGFSESVIWTRAAHTFTFGMQYARNDLNNRTDPNGRGTFNFTGLQTSAFDSNGLPVRGTGFDLADFLLGLPQSSSIRYGDADTYFRQNVWNAFTQDDWKVRPSLTLTLGVRYDCFSPFAEKYGRIANLAIAPDFSSVSVVVPALINPDRNNFSPRLAVAWKVPKFRRSTIVRAGYGIYYNGQAYNSIAPRLAQQPPFAVSNSINTSPVDVLTLAQGFVSTLPADVTNTWAVDPYYRTPYAQTWNVTIQHELPKGFFVELGYLGTKGTRLDVLTVPNQGPSSTRSSDQSQQIANASGFTLDSSVGNSIYHALQVRATQRFRKGVSMSAFYTYSKSIDDSSSFGGAGNTVAQNWLDLAAERGLSSFDRRHSFDTNWVLTSPFGSDTSRLASRGFLAGALRDWQLSGSLVAQSGTPLTARVLGNTAQLAQTGGIGSGRANATGQDLSSSTGFFNLAAFAAPLPGEFGNAGRNTIPGPGLFNLNLSFGRSFRLDQSRRRLEFRLEANNVLNHVSYTNIDTVVNATNYGLPVSAAAMRSLNAVLRIRF